MGEPNLGMATTRMLLEELETRMRVTQNSTAGRELGVLCNNAIAGLAERVLNYKTYDPERDGTPPELKERQSTAAWKQEAGVLEDRIRDLKSEVKGLQDITDHNLETYRIRIAKLLGRLGERDNRIQDLNEKLEGMRLVLMETSDKLTVEYVKTNHLESRVEVLNGQVLLAGKSQHDAEATLALMKEERDRLYTKLRRVYDELVNERKELMVKLNGLLGVRAQRDAAFGFITGFLQEAHRLVDLVPGLAGHRTDGPRNGAMMDDRQAFVPGAISANKGKNSVKGLCEECGATFHDEVHREGCSMGDVFAQAAKTKYAGEAPHVDQVPGDVWSE